MPIPTIVTYKGYKLLSVQPIGDGGVGLNDNFSRIGDHQEAAEAHMAQTTGAHGATSANVPNSIVQRDGSGGITVGSVSADAITVQTLSITTLNVHTINAESITDDISSQRVAVSKDGTIIGARKQLNFVSGGNTSVNVTENFANNRIDISVLATASTFIFNQVSPQTAWTITHNLNKFPTVTVVDSSGSWVVGNVNYVSANSLVVTFSAAFAGKAYLN